MFAWLAGLLVARLWRTQPRWMLAVPTPTAARWGGLLAAAGYALLAGWGVPAQRTVWMIATVVLLRHAGLRWPLHAVLLAAAAVVTLLDPWALLQAGFWLSFVAVALLVASEPVRAPGPASLAAPALGWRARAWAAARAALRTQAMATAGLAPLSMAFFQQISLVGFAANLVAIPVVTLLITPLALLGLLVPPLWPLGAWIATQLNAYLQALAGAPWAVWQAAVAPPWAVVCGLLGGLLAVMPLPWRLRLLAVPLVLPLLAPAVSRPEPGLFELVAADVGQGTAVLLRTANHLLVYDTGPAFSRDADAGGRVLVPLLRARGEDHVDLLMLSHRDTDHVGGAATLLRALPVAAIRSSLADAHPLRQLQVSNDPPHDRCTAGQHWEWDGVRFDVLHPAAADYDRDLKSNAMSCVLRVQGAQTTALLTGDAEAPQEAAMLARDAAALKADLLVVPHHGSRTSSTPAFIDAVGPQTAVFQAGYRSRYGHPVPDVVARYRERGIALVRSDTCGAWTQPSKHDLPGSCVRQSQRRYWHHPGNP
jgi:competence protein ComEC